jgi:hypothetical protein
MAEGRRAVLLGPLRDALQRRIDAVGLRQVAREIELDPSSLLNILRGGNPRSATRQRIIRWYFQQVREGLAEMSDPLAEEAIAALVVAMPSDARPEAARRLLRALSEIYGDFGTAVPSWIVQAIEEPERADLLKS